MFQWILSIMAGISMAVTSTVASISEPLVWYKNNISSQKSNSTSFVLPTSVPAIKPYGDEKKGSRSGVSKESTIEWVNTCTGIKEKYSASYINAHRQELIDRDKSCGSQKVYYVPSPTKKNQQVQQEEPTSFPCQIDGQTYVVSDYNACRTMSANYYNAKQQQYTIQQQQLSQEFAKSLQEMNTPVQLQTPQLEPLPTVGKCALGHMTWGGGCSKFE